MEHWPPWICERPYTKHTSRTSNDDHTRAGYFSYEQQYKSGPIDTGGDNNVVFIHLYGWSSQQLPSHLGQVNWPVGTSALTNPISVQ